MNKYAKPQEIEQKRIATFTYIWNGSRIPERITLPNEIKVKVLNMRNGTIILENGNTGTYKRVIDNNKTNERIIIIELEIE